MRWRAWSFAAVVVVTALAGLILVASGVEGRWAGVVATVLIAGLVMTFRHGAEFFE
jgi:hypothetical protein